MVKKSKEEKICAHTKKPVKRAQRFYRDGKFYANKNAFRAAQQAAKEAAAEATDAEAAS